MTNRRPTHVERRARADARRAARAEIQDPAAVLEAAAAFLAVRPRSVDETRRRLRHLGYPSAPIEVVLERLIEFGYLDDEAFARAWVESRDRARPRGEAALRRELTLKGIDREIVAGVLAARDVDAVRQSAAGPRQAGEPETAEEPVDRADEVAARRLIARRSAALAREPDPRKRRQRAYAMLARNGFAPDVCATVSAAAGAATDDGEAGEAGVDGV